MYSEYSTLIHHGCASSRVLLYENFNKAHTALTRLQFNFIVVKEVLCVKNLKRHVRFTMQKGLLLQNKSAPASLKRRFIL